MVSSRRIRVHESFIDAIGMIGKPIAEDLKKRYGLDSLVLDYPTMTQLAAGKLTKQKEFNFIIKKVGPRKGKLFLS